MVSQQQQVAELSLNPPDLGPLQIVLTVDNDQASAMFVSNNADVRQALEAALPRLKEMMADSGISLGNTTISSGIRSKALSRKDLSGEIIPARTTLAAAARRIHRIAIAQALPISMSVVWWIRLHSFFHRHFSGAAVIFPTVTPVPMRRPNMQP